MKALKVFSLKKKQITTCLILVFMLFIASLSLSFGKDYTDEVIERIIKEKGVVNIGMVVDVKNSDLSEGEKEELANQIADKLQEEFFKKISFSDRDKVKVVERKYLNTIIEEQKLSLSGLLGKDTVKVGKLAGLDIIFLLAYTTNQYAVKVLKVDSGEVLAVKTVRPEILVDHAIKVRASAFSEYKWNLKEGTILQISFNSNLDINVWMLDQPNFLRFRDGRDFNYYTSASRKRIYNSSFQFVVPKTGNYYFVLDNRFSILTPKIVTVKVLVINNDKIVEN